MYPYIHFILPSYTVLAFIGGFLAFLFVYSRIGRFGVDFGVFLKLFAMCVGGGFVGSRVLFIATRIPWLVQNFSFVNLINLLFNDGYVFYGGLFGVLLTIILYAKISKKYDAENLFSLVAPAIPLFHCFGRIGCFLAGCCYGYELSQPVMVNGLSFTRFPTQIMEALFEALLFITFIILEKHRRNAPLLKIYLTSYACFRFVIEFFRGDTIRGSLFGLSTSQWVSIIILLYIIGKTFRPDSIQTKTNQ